MGGCVVGWLGMVRQTDFQLLKFLDHGKYCTFKNFSKTRNNRYPKPYCSHDLLQEDRDRCVASLTQSSSTGSSERTHIDVAHPGAPNPCPLPFVSKDPQDLQLNLQDLQPAGPPTQPAGPPPQPAGPPTRRNSNSTRRTSNPRQIANQTDHTIPQRPSGAPNPCLCLRSQGPAGPPRTSNSTRRTSNLQDSEPQTAGPPTQPAGPPTRRPPTPQDLSKISKHPKDLQPAGPPTRRTSQPAGHPTRRTPTQPAGPPTQDK
nr:basic salivary proline-rich protein 2-like [Penaeus vannamei]